MILMKSAIHPTKKHPNQKVLAKFWNNGTLLWISAKSSLTSQLEMEAKMLQKNATPKKQKDDLDSDRDTDGEEKQVQVL